MNKHLERLLKFIYTDKKRVENIILGIKGAHRNYVRSNSTIWVSALCYFTVLSLVPIIAIAFSFGRFLGIDSFLASELYKNSPLDENSLKLLLDTSQNLLENNRSGVLAGIGFIFLAWIVISMFSIIEKSMNDIWRVEKNRSIFRKCTDYLIIFMIFPVTLLSLSILTSPTSAVAKMVPSLIFISAPYISVWIFFTVFYIVMPNCKINTYPAATASLLVSIVFNQSNLIFVKLQSLIIAYNKIYGSFSVILIFLFWLKIIWFLILAGAHLTYILQNSQSLGNIDGIRKLNFQSKFFISVEIAKLLTKNFLSNSPPLTSKEISKETSIPIEMVNDILDIFKAQNIVFESIPYDDFEKEYKLSFDYAKLTVGVLYEKMATYGNSYERLEEFSIDKDFLEKKIIQLI